MNDAVSDYVEGEGWEIIEKEDGRTILELGLRGSWFWHLLWFILLPILGNIIYSLWRRTDDRPKRKVIRVKEE